MSITDDEYFQYGYATSIVEAQSQLDQLILEDDVHQTKLEMFKKCRKTVPEEYIGLFEDGWAAGLITVKAAVGHWLHTPKLYINYRLSIKDVVKSIAEKYRYEMVPVDEEYDDEIKMAIFFEDITRGLNGAAKH